MFDKYHLVYHAGSGDKVTAKPQAHIESAAPKLPAEPSKLPPVPSTQEAAKDERATGSGPPVQKSWFPRILGWLGF